MPVTVRNTDILFNDGTTQSTAVSVNTTAVLNATAGASVGAVGTYVFARPESFGNWSAGATIAGSNLRYAGVTAGSPYSSTNHNTGSLINAGTWRAMGESAGGFGNVATLWLRIS